MASDGPSGPSRELGYQQPLSQPAGPAHPAPARSAGPPSTPAAEEWRADWVSSTLPELENLSRRLRLRPDVSIMRSSQLDAARLDDELTSLLREQFMRTFALFRPAAIARLQPELTLLLDFLIFRFSIWEGRPLPGMALMNLRYRNEAAVQPPPAWSSSLLEAAAGAAATAAASVTDSRGSSSSGGVSSSLGPKQLLPACVAGGHSGVEGPGLSASQRSLYCLGAVVLRYAWARLTQYAAVQHWGDAAGVSWRQRGWALMRRAESGYRLASLLNFLVFLRSGRYRSVLERLLCARLVYQQPSAARAISFEYLNRQLVWSELSELLLFLLPLVNVRAIKHALRSHLPRLPILAAASGAGSAGMGAAAAAAAVGSPGPVATGSSQQQQPCGICGATDILTPYEAVPCSHRFCYYCLRSHCLADPQYSCPLCLTRVDAMRQKRWGDGPDGSSSSSDGGRRGAGGSA